MSFGFGVGCFLAVSQLALDVHKSFKSAPKELEDLEADVGGLCTILKGTEGLLSKLGNNGLNRSNDESLSELMFGCRSVLDDLQAFVEKFRRPGTSQLGTVDRLLWDHGDVSYLRERLISTVVLLTAFNSNISASVLPPRAAMRRLTDRCPIERRRIGSRKNLTISLRSGERD